MICFTSLMQATSVKLNWLKKRSKQFSENIKNLKGCGFADMIDIKENIIKSWDFIWRNKIFNIKCLINDIIIFYNVVLELNFLKYIYDFMTKKIAWYPVELDLNTRSFNNIQRF
jgi:hypothetical protein